MPYAADDRLSGAEGIATIDTGGTPIILDITEWNYREIYEHLKGRTAGNRGTGRTHLGTDFELNIIARTRDTGATPNFFRRNAANSHVAFEVKTDNAATPAVKVAGNGMITEADIVTPVGDFITYRMKIQSDDSDE